MSSSRNFAGAQLLLALIAMLMSVWAGSPWVWTLGIVAASICPTIVGLSRKIARSGIGTWSARLALPVTLCLTVLVFALEPVPIGSSTYWDNYYACIAWVVALNFFVADTRIGPGPLRGAWRGAALAWAYLGNVICLEAAYLQNKPLAFYLALALALLLLVATKRLLRLPFFAIQIVNSLILIVIGLPLLDLAVYARGARSIPPGELRNYATYSAAKTNPAAFQRWWNYFSADQLSAMFAKVLITNGAPQKPYRLRPDSSAVLIQSTVSINSQGFRGKEIAARKDHIYRIVVVGESSTFGLTIGPQEKTWPEMLQELIDSRLHPNRPVEVINAGVPGASLLDNLRRFQSEILPLKPDMLISYHGYNGFPLMATGLAPVHGKQPPIHIERPLRLLADCEFRIKLDHYKRTEAHKLLSQHVSLLNAMDTEFARGYERLIGICATNGIRLVLANFSMAVNGQSPPEAIEFFRARFPAVYSQIRVCAAHSALVSQLSKLHPEVCLVDTQPHFDGEYDKFLDLMHPSEAGDRQLAENVFNGIRQTLVDELNKNSTNSNASDLAR